MARVRYKSGTSHEDPDLDVRPEQGAQPMGKVLNLWDLTED